MKTAMQKSVGVLASEAIERYLQKAESYEKAVIQDHDPEDLHQMRVNLRRLRTAMQVFAPSIRLPKAGRESQVAGVARSLGALRDLDVIIEILNQQYAPDLPEAERETLEQVFKNGAKQRKKAYKQVKKELKGDRYDDLKSSLHAWAVNPDCNETARLDINAVLPDLAMPLVSQLWLHPGWLVGVKATKGVLKPNTRMSAATVDDLVADCHETLHSFRKQVKRVRYQLKFVSPFYGDRLDDDLSRLSQLQDLLGGLQDSFVMAEFLENAIAGWEQAMPTLKALLADSRHRAWKQWQTHQQYYLDPQNRESLRHILLTPGLEEQPKTPAKSKSRKTTPKKTTPQKPSSTRRKSPNNASKSSSSQGRTSTKPTPSPDSNGKQNEAS
jgi:CHAD domain-containing protein